MLQKKHDTIVQLDEIHMFKHHTLIQMDCPGPIKKKNMLVSSIGLQRWISMWAVLKTEAKMLFFNHQMKKW